MFLPEVKTYCLELWSFRQCQEQTLLMPACPKGYSGAATALLHQLQPWTSIAGIVCTGKPTYIHSDLSHRLSSSFPYPLQSLWTGLVHNAGVKPTPCEEIYWGHGERNPWGQFLSMPWTQSLGTAGQKWGLSNAETDPEHEAQECSV